MKKSTKKLVPQHELTIKEREFFEALKDMTRKRGGKRPANGEIAREMGLDPGRVTRLMQMLSLKGYYAVEETVRFA